MTDIEHMIAWIESSQPHYKRLLNLEEDRKACSFAFNAVLAQKALGIVLDAYREAVRGGDMFGEQWSPAAILDAAKALLSWELEQ